MNTVSEEINLLIAGAGNARLAVAKLLAERDALRARLEQAEKLAEALRDVSFWIENWSPEFCDDPEWDESEHGAKSALKKWDAGKKEG